MRYISTIILVPILLAAATAFAQGTAPPAKIADVAWLQGYWSGEGFGGALEEVWMPPRSGVMLGAFRLMKGDGTRASGSFQEILAIEEFEGSLRLVIKHFHPDWVGWEEKDQALKLRLTRIDAQEAVFGGVALRRVDDRLEVELVIKQRDGNTRTEKLGLRRQAL